MCPNQDSVSFQKIIQKIKINRGEEVNKFECESSCVSSVKGSSGQDLRQYVISVLVFHPYCWDKDRFSRAFRAQQYIEISYLHRFPILLFNSIFGSFHTSLFSIKLLFLILPQLTVKILHIILFVYSPSIVQFYPLRLFVSSLLRVCRQVESF